MKRRIGILLEFGFHEIKKYIHSGFADKLVKEFDIIWLAIDKGNEEFHNYFSAVGKALIYIDPSHLSSIKSKAEQLNQSVRSAWLKKSKLGAFHNYKRITNLSFKQKLIANNIFKSFFENQAIRSIENHYPNQYLKTLFEENGITDLLFTGYASSFSKSAVITATKNKIKTWYVVNSWKDLFTNSFLPFRSITGMFVWSEKMKKDYLHHNPYLDASKIFVTGNPTFDVLMDYHPKQDFTFYEQKYQIPINSKLFYYTMMPPGLVNDEIETIELIGNYLLKFHPKEKLSILLRRNPNHNKAEFIDRDLPENIILTEHFCTYDQEKDMIVQSKEGEYEWLDLLHYCHANMGVPSTVTLEFLTLNKPVFNIEFGPNELPDSRIQQHFKSGFYLPLFKNAMIPVYRIDTLEKLKNKLEQTLFKKVEERKDMHTKKMQKPASSKILQHLKDRNLK